MGQRPRNPNKEGFTAKMPLYSGTIQQAIGLPHGWVHGGTLNWNGRAPPGRPALDESGLPPDAAVADPEKPSALHAECVGNDPGWLVPRLATRPGRSRLLGIRCAAVFSAVRVTGSESHEKFCPVFSRVFAIECRRGCEPPTKGPHRAGAVEGFWLRWPAYDHLSRTRSFHEYDIVLACRTGCPVGGCRCLGHQHHGSPICLWPRCRVG